MSEEKKDNPKFMFKDIKLGESQELTVSSAQPIATGMGKYGEWRLWPGVVENATVRFGKTPNERVEKGYSGDVIFFPSPKLHEDILSTVNGSESVKIRVTKTAEEGNKGLITKYVVEKVSGGTSSSSSLTPTELKLINEANELKNDGHNVTEEIFVAASQEPQYEGKISRDRAKKLYTMLD